MGELFNRDVKIVAGPLTIAARTATGASQPVLAIKFSIEKTLSSGPNKGALTIYNLSEANRTRLQEKGLEVTIEAGYVDEVVQICKMDIEHTAITRDAVNWVTEVELVDGGAARKKSRTNVSFRGGQSIGSMLGKAVEGFGDALGLGNLKEKIASGGGRSALKEFISGFVLSGKTDDIVDKLAASMGLKFSVQDKEMLFLGKGEVIPGPPVLLDLTAGLIGSPSVGEKGVVTAKSLLNGRIRPGRRVLLSSLTVSGDYYADKVKHSGETWGDDWTTEVELAPL